MPKSRTLCRPLVAACGACPLRCKDGAKPIPLTIHTNPQAIIILDHPSARDRIREELLAGPIGAKVKESLDAVGIERYSVLCRMSCYPPRNKRLDKHLRAATKACNTQFHHDLEALDPTRKVPLLIMGKWASSWLGNVDYSLRSGASVRVPLPKLARGTLHGRIMTLDTPAYAWWGKPAMQVPWLTGLQRFADLIHGVVHAPPPQPIIHPTEEALAALRGMGSVIGWDVETLGVDPLTAPLTCVGISDGVQTISVPWDDYETATEGLIRGVNKSVRKLHQDIRNEVLNVLASDRIQVTQNGTYDALAMGARGLPGRNDWDIMHAHSILWPEIRHNLEDIAMHLVPSIQARWKTIFRAGKDDDAKGDSAYESARAEDLRDYNGRDCLATVLAYEPLLCELAKED